MRQVLGVTDAIRKQAAARYWAAKNGGTVAQLALSFGISEPTLLKRARLDPESEIGQRFTALKSREAIAAIAADFGVSIPTLRNWAMEFFPGKEGW